MKKNKIYRKILEHVFNIDAEGGLVDISDLVGWSQCTQDEFTSILGFLKDRNMLRIKTDIPPLSTQQLRDGIIPSKRIYARMTPIGHDTAADDLDTEFPLEIEPTAPLSTASEDLPALDIFVSHSSEDIELASALVDLLQSALTLHPKKIRCTSLDGYRLPGGANPERTIKNEVFSATTVVALLTKASIDSTYVLFELGARWGTNGTLIPLATPDIDFGNIEPISSIFNILCIDNDAQVFQLIDEVAEALHLEKPSAPAFLAKVKYLSSLARNYTVAKPTADSPLVVSDNGTQLRPEAIELLLCALEDKGGQILAMRTKQGLSVSSNGKVLCETGNNRSGATYRVILKELREKGLIEDVGGSPGQIFQITEQGYNFASSVS